MRKPPFIPELDSIAFGSPEWKRRYQADTFPQHKIRLETENHYSYINLQIQNYAELGSFVGELVRDLEEVTANRVMYIGEIRQNGLTRTLYTAASREALPPDADLRVAVRVYVNYRDRVSLLTPSTDGFVAKAFRGLLERWFCDTLGLPITKTVLTSIWSIEAPQWQLKRKQHPAYARPHSESEGSPIEALLRDALTGRGVTFREQEKVVVDGRVFTVPDFLVEEPLLAIYCDGTEFHKDAERIIRDKQQDRVLQRMGYRVFRFSGSEIVADARQCADEIIEFVCMVRPPVADSLTESTGAARPGCQQRASVIRVEAV